MVRGLQDIHPATSQGLPSSALQGAQFSTDQASFFRQADTMTQTPQRELVGSLVLSRLFFAQLANRDPRNYSGHHCTIPKSPPPSQQQLISSFTTTFTKNENEDEATYQHPPPTPNIRRRTTPSSRTLPELHQRFPNFDNLASFTNIQQRRASTST